MTPPQSDSHADDLRNYFEQPEVWTQVSQGLQRIALAIVGNERDAEDVVQGAWLEALRDPSRHTSMGWLRKLVRFRAIDVLRRRSRDPVLPASEESALEVADTHGKLEAQREVLDAVQTLKEPYLSTIVLRYFEGKSPKAIADRLGVPERTVKTRLTRAHALLRARLGARYQDSFGNWAPALLIFSGYVGPRASPLALPTFGVLLMNKKLLAITSLALVVCIPFAWQSGGATPENMGQPESTDQALVDLASESEVESPEIQNREAVVGTPQVPPKAPAPFEYAFPPLLASESGTLGIRVFWSDGSPAEHLKMNVMADSASDAFLGGRTVYTGANGFVQVDRVPPGPVTVYFHRLGSETVEVSAGGYTPLDKQAERGSRFTGQVLGPNGHPVGGALIFMADSRGGDSLPEPSAVADGAGRYELQSVFDHSYISARAAGFSPSIPLDTGVATADAMELDLVLRGDPARLQGLVLSPAGVPVVGALIRIELSAVSDDAGGQSGFPLAFVLQSDAEGRFETDQIGAGEVHLIARTATWQPWQKSLRLEPEEVRELVVRFEPGLELTGVVREENGDPIPGTFLVSGNAAGPGSYRVQTDASGMYRILGLPPGTSEFSIFHEGFEGIDTQRTLRADTTNQIDFTLHRLQAASGVVVDQSGAPLAHWYVAVESEKGLWSAGGWTADDGQFQIVGIPDGTTDLIVTTEDYWESATRFAVPAVLPSTNPLRIVVPDAAAPRSSIRMKLQVDGQPAPRETRVRLRSSSPLTHRDVHPSADGTLRLERLANRVYHLDVTLDGFAPLHKTLQLGAAEDKDLGTLHLSPGGRVQVDLGGALSDAPATFHYLDRGGRSLLAFPVQNGSGISPLLPEGTLTLRYCPTNGATQFARVQVFAGETTVTRFMTRPGTRWTIPVQRRDGQPIRYQTQARVTDARGRTHYFTEDLQRDNSGTIELGGLELGRYQIRIQDPGGPVQEAWLDVSTLEEKTVPVALDW